ncbi:MAG: lysostaphin resistance A-like protein [Chitinophagales bacterium]
MNNLFSEHQLNEKPALAQYSYLLFVIGMCFLLTVSTHFVIMTLCGIDIESPNMENLSTLELTAYKFIQIFSTILLFILPAILFSLLKRGNFSYLKMHNGIKWSAAFLATTMVFAALPSVFFSKYLNDLLVLPNSLLWLEEMMRNMEDNAEKMTVMMLQMDNPLDLFLNLFMIAVLPALGEELFFRGAVQTLIQETSKKPHLAIWTAAAVFSFFHFQFYGFLPRLLLGAFFGYLFFWSGNLWYPIIGHFINNGSQVIAYYFSEAGAKGEDLGEMPSIEGWQMWLSLTIIIGFSLLYIYQSSKHFQKITSEEIA